MKAAGQGRWQPSSGMSIKRTRARQPRGKRPALVFAALGDQTRLHIVTRLGAAGPLSIVNLTAGTGVTRQAVSKHLRILDRAGLVRARRVGRETLWRLEPDQLDVARQALDQISAQWDIGLARLKAFVER
jgi:DNA-binding transcriptional ArsR family regulator